MAVWNIIKLTDIRPDRCDAEYFRKDYKENLDFLNATGSTTTLGRLFKKVERGEKPEYQKVGPIPVLRSVNIRALDFNDTRQEYVTENFYNSKPRGQVLKDDILFTCTGTGTLGRTSIWFKDTKAFNVPENSFLRDPIDIDPYLIAAFFNTPYGIEQLFQHQRGSSGQLHLYPVDIRRIIVPECLFPYQQEIGDYLRKAFALQQKSSDLYKEAVTLLSDALGLDKIVYSNANFYTTTNIDCVRERIIDPKYHHPKFEQIENHLRNNFETVELRKIADVEYGYMPMQDYEKDPNKGIPLIRVTNITDHLEIKMEDLKFIPNWVQIPRKKYVEKGDILMVQLGDTTGKVGYIFEDVKNHLFPSFCLSVKVKDDRFNSLFLSALLKSELIQILFDKTVLINTVRPNTTKPRFEKLLIPLFEMDFQLKIAALLEKSFLAKKESKLLIEMAKQRVVEIIKESAIK